MRTALLILVMSTVLYADVVEDVRKIPIGGKMIVILPDGREHFGRLGHIANSDFELNDGASGQRVTFRYDEVKKVLKGYAGRTLNGGRAHLRRSRVIAIVVVGSLVALAFIAAASLK